MEMWSQTRHAAACWENLPRPLLWTGSWGFWTVPNIISNQVIQRAAWNYSSRARSFHCHRRNDTCISLNRWFFPWWWVCSWSVGNEKAVNLEAGLDKRGECSNPLHVAVDHKLVKIHGKEKLHLEIFKRKCWSGLPFPPPRGLPNPGIEPASLTSPALASRFFTTSATWEAQNSHICI